jgi:spore maturation protein CgeB
LCSSPINIVIHFQDGETLCYQAAPRVYEALACRSFLLVDDQKDVQSLFQDGKHLVIFKNTEDLREKITYYLKHPEMRKKIASQGYEETVHKHTYLLRLKEMFSVIEAGG